MRDYGTVTPRFWIGDTGKALRGDPEAQVLALYLMTSPHSTMTGVFHCPILYMAHETGLSIEGATKALARLSEVGFCEYEEASEVVFVLRMAAFQIGASLKATDNRVAGLRREVERMGSPRMKARFLEVYGVAYCLVEASPSEAPPKPRTGTGTRTGTRTKKAPPPPTGGAEGFDRFWASWPQHKRKVAEGQCRAKWEAKGCEPIADRIIAALETLKGSPDWLKDGGQFIPAPLVWLNQSRWEAANDEASDIFARFK